MFATITEMVVGQRAPPISFSYQKLTILRQYFVHKYSESKNVSGLLMYTKASLTIYGMYVLYIHISYQNLN